MFVTASRGGASTMATPDQALSTLIASRRAVYWRMPQQLVADWLRQTLLTLLVTANRR